MVELLMNSLEAEEEVQKQQKVFLFSVTIFGKKYFVFFILENKITLQNMIHFV